MVLIFGWGQSDARDLGEVAPALCPNCHNVVALHHVRTKKAVSLFFVPVMPYGGDEYLLCPICRRGLQLTAPQKPVVTAMSRATTALRHNAIAREAYVAQVAAFWSQMGFPAYAPPVADAAASPPGVPGGPPRLPVAQAGLPGPVAPGGTRSTAEQLDDLARLHGTGVLTDEEYRAAVKRIVGV